MIHHHCVYLLKLEMCPNAPAGIHKEKKMYILKVEEGQERERDLQKKQTGCKEKELK